MKHDQATGTTATEPLERNSLTVTGATGTTATEPLERQPPESNDSHWRHWNDVTGVD